MISIISYGDLEFGIHEMIWLSSPNEPNLKYFDFAVYGCISLNLVVSIRQSLQTWHFLNPQF